MSEDERLRAIVSEPAAQPWVRVTINEDGQITEMALETFLCEYCKVSTTLDLDRLNAAERLARYAAAVKAHCTKTLDRVI
jgi:hypothetical protein